MEDFECTTIEYETIKRYERTLIEYLSRLYSTGLTRTDYFRINSVIKFLYERLKEAYQNFTTKYACVLTEDLKKDIIIQDLIVGARKKEKNIE